MNTPGQHGLQVFLSIQQDGSYATYRGTVKEQPAETGQIQLSNRSTYTMTAQTGANAGRRDSGSIRFLASNQVLISGRNGSSTWTRVPDAHLSAGAMDLQHPVTSSASSAENVSAPPVTPPPQLRWNSSAATRSATPPTIISSSQTVTTVSPGSAKPTLPKDRPVQDKWALVIGISKFQKPDLDLKCAAADATDFGSFLVKECNFAADHVHVLTNEQATRTQILNELGDKWLPRVVRPDDLVVVYVSTHGSPADVDLGGINYLVAWDTDPDSLYASGLPMQDLMRLIKGRLRSDRVMIVLDACYSGNVNPQGKGLHRGGNLNVDDVVQGTGQLVISSSESNQISWESKTGSNSVFTKHLMAALRSKGDKTKLADAFRTLKERVEDEVQRDRGKVQIPVLKSQWEGSDLMLAVPPSDPRPGL